MGFCCFTGYTLLDTQYEVYTLTTSPPALVMSRARPEPCLQTSNLCPLPSHEPTLPYRNTTRPNRDTYPFRHRRRCERGPDYPMVRGRRGAHRRMESAL